MDIYLDIDRAMIHEDHWVIENQGAAGLAEFIIALRPYNTYWLTTHCREGNPYRPREILKYFLQSQLHADIGKID